MGHQSLEADTKIFFLKVVFIDINYSCFKIPRRNPWPFFPHNYDLQHVMVRCRCQRFLCTDCESHHICQTRLLHSACISLMLLLWGDQSRVDILSPSPITPRPNLALESGHIPKNRSNLGDFSFFSGILNDSTCRYKSSAFVALPKHISPGIQIDRGFSSFDLGLRMGLLSFWKGGVPDQTFVRKSKIADYVYISNWPLALSLLSEADSDSIVCWASLVVFVPFVFVPFV